MPGPIALSASVPYKSMPGHVSSCFLSILRFCSISFIQFYPLETFERYIAAIKSNNRTDAALRQQFVDVLPLEMFTPYICPTNLSVSTFPGDFKVRRKLKP
ncbi:hypothetical protein SAMN05444008_101259 [Cnuella takakiae]|uniref:Uncharacterized protein n=1 Tax=Cnuella takakiae TaxID=1302690 RepID=A0A1M4SWQ5_9BACT|nr:hypothetical protein SAMN05444008_101259 [Cnuella takakiae]